MSWAYVVLSDNSAYDCVQIHVSGVFTTKELAQAHIASCKAREKEKRTRVAQCYWEYTDYSIEECEVDV